MQSQDTLRTKCSFIFKVSFYIAGSAIKYLVINQQIIDQSRNSIFSRNPIRQYCVFMGGAILIDFSNGYFVMHAITK